MAIDYLIEYDEFQNKFRLTEVSGEEVGVLIMRLANYYSRYNIRMGEALRRFSEIKAGFQNQTDEATGKGMSSSKAEVLAASTTEAATYEMARIHVNNIEQMLNGLKALQRGLMVEYNQS
jgi:hypothetical protein